MYHSLVPTHPKKKTNVEVIRMKRVSIFSVKLVKESAKLYDIDSFSKSITSPFSAVSIINKVLDMENLPNEHFVILTLGTKNNILGCHTIHIGSLNVSIVHPREVFQQAILNNAASIICFHNHPSGNSSPSNEDFEVTKRLKDAGKILGIDVLDHIVIGRDEYTSLKEKGYL